MFYTAAFWRLEILIPRISGFIWRISGPESKSTEVLKDSNSVRDYYKSNPPEVYYKGAKARQLDHPVCFFKTDGFDDLPQNRHFYASLRRSTV